MRCILIKLVLRLNWLLWKVWINLSYIYNRGKDFVGRGYNTMFLQKINQLTFNYHENPTLNEDHTHIFSRSFPFVVTFYFNSHYTRFINNILYIATIFSYYFGWKICKEINTLGCLFAIFTRWKWQIYFLRKCTCSSYVCYYFCNDSNIRQQGPVVLC